MDSQSFFVVTELWPKYQRSPMRSRRPFRPLTEEEDQWVVQEINDSRSPGFSSVGLNTPKQEYWMAAQKGGVRAVMVGVGAAFRPAVGRCGSASVALPSGHRTQPPLEEILEA